MAVSMLAGSLTGGVEKPDDDVLEHALLLLTNLRPGVDLILQAGERPLNDLFVEQLAFELQIATHLFQAKVKQLVDNVDLVHVVQLQSKLAFSRKTVKGENRDSSSERIIKIFTCKETEVEF